MKKATVKQFALGAALLLVVAAPFLVFAQDTGGGSNVPTTPGQVQTSLQNVVGWMFTFFWIAAVGYIIFAAFLFLSAGSNEEQVEKAKKQILYALIAAAVVLLANGIEAIVKSLLSGS